VVASLLTLCAAATFAATRKSAEGTWKLDTGKSSYGTMPAPTYEQLKVDTDTPAALKWTITGASGDGKSFTVGYDGPIDGKFHPVMSNDGTTVAYKRDAGGNLSWTVKDKDGNVIESATGHLSADGNTLTLKGTLSGPSGKSDFVSVFSKAQ
jgi:hypothetical protein